MATSNRSGPNSAANPPQERPQERGIDHRDAEAGVRWWNALTEPQRAAALAAAKTATPAEAWAYFKAPANPERAWLDGTRWLACLTMDERANVFRTFGVAPPAADAGTGAASHAATLDDIARDIRGWGSVGLYGAADRLEAVASSLLAGVSAPTAAPAAAPQRWAPDAERVSLARDALYQSLQVADLLIGELDRADQRHDFTHLHLALTVRVRELADAADLLLTSPDDEPESVDDAKRLMFGAGHVLRTAEGVAS